MKITVITVCYNSAKTIERTIKSVIGQDYLDKEYIIVDGGSTDGTIDIIKKYNENITKWISEPDNGIFDAMNKGIALATGEVIAFLNSDDWYIDSALSIVHTEFMQSPCDCVCCDNYVIRKDGSEVYYDPSHLPLEDMYKRMIYFHSAIFGRAEWFKKSGNFDLKYKIAADYDWVLRIMKQGAKLHYLHKPIFTFCYGGVSSVNEIECAREARIIALRHLPETKGNYRKDIDDRYFSIVAQASCKEAVLQALQRVIKNDYPVILWGAGKRGKYCLEWLQSKGVPIMAVIDSNKGGCGGDIQGVGIHTPQFLEGRTCNVVITPEKYIEEIKNRIQGIPGNFKVLELENLRREVGEEIEISGTI